MTCIQVLTKYSKKLSIALSVRHWPGLHLSIKELICFCNICQQHKSLITAMSAIYYNKIPSPTQLSKRRTRPNISRPICCIGCGQSVVLVSGSLSNFTYFILMIEISKISLLTHNKRSILFTSGEKFIVHNLSLKISMLLGEF